MKVADMTVAELTKLYIQLRDRRAQRKAAYVESDESDKQKQEKIEAILLKRFQDEGVDSSKTEFGTAYKSVKTSVSVADRDSYLEWVAANENWAFLDVKANKTAVDAYKEEYNDLPPGLNWREEIAINVRRS